MNNTAWPLLGCGVGLRNEHYAYVLSKQPNVDWFEAISENFMDSGGRPIQILEKVRELYPVALHGTSLSIASSDEINPQYLSRLKALVSRIEPAIVSDHLCWSGIDGERLYDLLPVPFTEEALQLIVQRVDQLQSFLKRRILLENVSTYVTYQHSEMPEWEFITEVAQRSGCGILLDLNNIYVNAFNHQFDPYEYLESIPGELVGQFHLAGHTNRGNYLFDTHSAKVIPPVWDLYEKALKQWGKIATLIEWDEEIPMFPQLLAEADQAKAYYVSAAEPIKVAMPKNQKKSDSKQLNGKIKLPLAKTQRWFKSRIQPLKQYDRTQETSIDLNLQRGTPGEERLSVYAGGYVARIHESLKETYEAVRHFLGDSLFMYLAQNYAESKPLHSYNLSGAGEGLPEFLKTWEKTKDLPFLPDLAVLEWKITCSFHAFDQPALEPAALLAVKPEQWEHLKLIFQPSVFIAASQWPVWDLWQARKTPVKELQIHLVDRPQQILIGRPNGSTEVVCELIDMDQYHLLEGLLQEMTLGEGVENLVSDDQEVNIDLQKLFSRWMGLGLISRYELSATASKLNY